MLVSEGIGLYNLEASDRIVPKDDTFRDFDAIEGRFMTKTTGRDLILAALLLASASPLSGCGSRDQSAASLRIAAASDLQTALPTIIERYRSSRKIDVEPVFGASGQLAKQIGQGAPFDLFLSANRTFVEELAAKGAIEPQSVRRYAGGVLVLVVNAKSSPHLLSLADLARPEVKKIAIANPAFAPYGVAASQVIERSKLSGSLSPKIVMADTVRHALQFVQTGNAEAGLVAHSVSSVPDVRAIAIDPALHDPIDQYQGIVSGSRNKAAAPAFADFLTGKEGQSLLREFGFRTTEQSPTAPKP